MCALRSSRKEIMAGKLNVEESKALLLRLDAVSRSLGTCVQSLGECQKGLEKSIQCQNYLNYSLEPIQKGFVLKENEKTLSGPETV